MLLIFQRIFKARLPFKQLHSILSFTSLASQLWQVESILKFTNWTRSAFCFIFHPFKIALIIFRMCHFDKFVEPLFKNAALHLQLTGLTWTCIFSSMLSILFLIVTVGRIYLDISSFMLTDHSILMSFILDWVVTFQRTKKMLITVVAERVIFC